MKIHAVEYSPERDKVCVYTDKAPYVFTNSKLGFEDLIAFIAENFTEPLPELDINLNFKVLTPKDIANAISKKANKMDFSE